MTMEHLVYAVNCEQDILFFLFHYFSCVCASVEKGKLKFHRGLKTFNELQLCEPNNNNSAFFQIFLLLCGETY